jgi:hypothetical protein
MVGAWPPGLMPEVSANGALAGALREPHRPVGGAFASGVPIQI